MGGWPWSRGCGGARGPGAVAVVAAGLTSESRAGVGTELRIRVGDKAGSYWARSRSTPSHLGGEGTEALNLPGPSQLLVWGRGEEGGGTFLGAAWWARERAKGGAAASESGPSRG